MKFAAMLFIGAIATVIAPAGAAAQSRAEKPLVQSAGPSTEEIVDQTAEFAAWVLRLADAATPAIDATRSIQGEWARAMQLGGVEAAARAFRPVIARSSLATAEARQRILALDTPDFPLIGLPADLQTPVLRDQMVQTVDQIDVMIQSFGPLLDAMVANDERAGTLAATQMFSAARTLYDSQRLFARAGLATTESGSPEYHATEFDIAFYEAGGRLIDAASRIVVGQRDPSLGRDLLRFADDMDRIGRDGVRAAVARKQESEAEALAEAGTSGRLLLDRIQRMDASQQRAFGLWRGFATSLRTGGERANTRPITFADLRVMTDRLAPLRIELDEISLDQARILAGQQ